MKAYKLALVTLVSLFLTLTTNAQSNSTPNRIVVIGGAGENDNSFKMLSYRRSIGDSGFIVRGDILESTYPTGVNQELEETNEAIRVAVGKKFVSEDGDSEAAIYLGAIDQEDDTSSDSGLYAAAEYFRSFNEVNGFFANLEYSKPDDTYYFGSHLTFGFGNFHVGPTIAFLDSNDYEFSSYGVKMTTKVNENLHVVLTLSKKDEENQTGSDLESNVGDLVFIFDF